MANPFDQFDAPTAAAPNLANQFGRPVIRTFPEPKTPPMQTPAQAQGDALDVQLKTQQLADAKAKASAKAKDFDQARQEMLNVIQNAVEAHRMARSGPTTEWGSYILGAVPGTKAHDLQAKLDTIGGNVAFERLQRMRQESPTGGAVGNVSDADMKLLKSTVTSLDPTQTRAQFLDSMRRIVGTYGRVLGKMPGGKDAYDNWRKGFLGFDPHQQGGGAPAQGAPSDGKLIKGADGVLEWHP